MSSRRAGEKRIAAEQVSIQPFFLDRVWAGKPYAGERLFGLESP